MSELHYTVSQSISYTAHLLTVGQKQYAASAVTANFTAHAAHDENGAIDLSAFSDDLLAAIADFHSAIFIGVDNTVLLHHLQPKSGYSAQEFLEVIKQNLHKQGSNGFMVLGRETPPVTLSALLVVVTASDPTLETIGRIVMARMASNEIQAPKVSKLEVTNGTGMGITLTPAAEPQLPL